MKFNIDYRQFKLPCVVKITFGNRYIIVKCKNIKTTIQIFRHNIKLHDRYANTKSDNLFLHAVKYITRQKIETAQVECMLQSNNQYELLKKEQQLLNESVGDKNCLNNNVEAYIPEWDEDTMSYGWLNKTAVMNFKRALHQL